MRAVVQRVARASVSVDGEIVGQIGRGLLVLLGVAVGDAEQEADWMADKLVGLRIFENAAGKFDQSVRDVGGAIMVISQFTLYGDARKGRRPSFTAAAGRPLAETLYRRVIERIAGQGIPAVCGRFGARMQVSLLNDGPVTLVIDSDPAARSSA